MTDKRAHGVLYISVDNEMLKGKGDFSYNLGLPKKEAILGLDGVHGYTVKQQAAFIEGDLTIDGGYSLTKLLKLSEAYVVLKLHNGKTIALDKAWCSSEGTVEAEEGKLKIKFESDLEGTEIREA